MLNVSKSIFITFLLVNSLACFQSDKSKSAAAAGKQSADQCDDAQLIYKTCTDQKDIYDAAKSKAVKENKSVLVQFGFETCGWCINLHQVFNNEMKDFINKNFVVAEINIKEKSGVEVFDQLKDKDDRQANKTGYPHLVIFNPKDQSTVHQGTGDLEDNSGGKTGHNLAKVKAALQAALKGKSIKFER